MGFEFDPLLEGGTAPPPEDEVEELALLAEVTSAMAAGEAPDNLLRRLLTLIAEVCGRSRAILGVSASQMGAVAPHTPASGRTVLGQGAEIVCSGEYHLVISDWGGAEAPLLLDHGTRLVIPQDKGGVLVLDPAPDVVLSGATMQLLRVLTDLASGAIASVVRLAEANRRAAALEDTRKRLRERNTILREMAILDELTGLNNRRFFERRMEYELERVQRYQLPLGLILFDIDHFKRVNDTYGHPVGDEVLRSLSAIARRALRRVDTLSRIGGEEFAVLMPNTTPAGALHVAERLRASAEAQRLETGAAVVQWTISLGVVAVEGGWGGGRDLLFRLADDALYEAKEGGRNRVVQATAPTE